jgi:hypothetical protein
MAKKAAKTTPTTRATKKTGTGRRNTGNARRSSTGASVRLDRQRGAENGPRPEDANEPELSRL